VAAQQCAATYHVTAAGDGMLAGVEEQYRLLQQARPMPHVRDDDTVGRVITVFTEQRDGLWLFEEQLRRWDSQERTEAQRRKIGRVSGRLERLRRCNVTRIVSRLAGHRVAFLSTDDLTTGAHVPQSAAPDGPPQGRMAFPTTTIDHPQRGDVYVHIEQGGDVRSAGGWRVAIGTTVNRHLYGAVAFFQLEHGLHLAFWPWIGIARDTGTGLALHPRRVSEITLGHNVGSPQEVDVVMTQVGRARVRIVTACVGPDADAQ
jgi:hypothetical protein